MLLRYCIGVLLLIGTAQANRKSEGRSFAVAFSASRSDLPEGWCKLNINTKGSTDVNVTTPTTGSTIYQVDSNDVLVVEIPTDLRTLEGTENKAIYVEALSDDITVTLSNYRDTDQIGEAMLAIPKNDTLLNEFHIMSYPSQNDVIQCRSGSTISFYSIIAYESDTQVIIYEPAFGGGYTERSRETIELGQVFTERWIRDGTENDFEISGFRVVSNKAVSVTGGNSCTDIATGNNAGEGPIWATMPSTSQAGTQFITHAIVNSRGSHDYTVRVLALQDNTRIQSRDSGVDERINAGIFYSFVLSGSYEEDVISCSNPCIVVEYGMDDESSIFMTVLPPTSQYNTDVVFTLPATMTQGATSLDHFINIVMTTNTPASSGITLDGVDISGEAWNTGADYSYISIAMTGGVELPHRLVSNELFSVLVHAQIANSTGRGGDGHGFLAAVGMVGDDVVPTSGPPSDRDPLYRISMTGGFQTSTVLDSLCTAQYSNSLNIRSTGMIAQTNDLIGSPGMCENKTANDVTILAASTIFLPDPASVQGLTILNFILRVNLATMTIEEITTCGTEIGDYLAIHANWPSGDPLPDISGCPSLNFNSNMFNISGSDWICPVNSADNYNIPRFTMSHLGDLETADSSDISTDCLISYSVDFSESTLTQILFVNDMLASNLICSAGKDGNVTILTGTTSLSPSGNTGSSYQTYIFDTTPGTSTTYLYSCVDEISLYMQPHTNWDEPIIAGAGCPDVVFPSKMFTEDSKKWLC